MKRFERVKYASLKARQKEIFNFQKVASHLADFGFNCIKLADDWQGADFLAYHKDGNDTLKAQLKPRPTVMKKYEGKGLWMAFPLKGSWYLIGKRPALTLSPEAYNRKVGLAIFCPITTQVKGYPFEVSIPNGFKAEGVVLSDQVKSFDWQSRGSQFFCKLPDSVISEVLGKLEVLLS